MQIVNQYSAVFVLIFPLGLIGLAFVWRRHPMRSRIVGGIGLLLLAAIGFFLVQPEANSIPVNDVATLLETAPGQPVFIELYSDYWAACLRARPIVDGLEAEWGDSVRVVRLNVHDVGVDPLLAQLNFRFTPTFVLLDSTGEESWRVSGVLDPVIVREQVKLLRPPEAEATG